MNEISIQQTILFTNSSANHLNRLILLQSIKHHSLLQSMAGSLARLVRRLPKTPISNSIIKFCLTKKYFKTPIIVKWLVNAL